MPKEDCPWCKEPRDKETWVNLGKGKLALICFNCASKVHTKYLAELEEEDKKGYGKT